MREPNLSSNARRIFDLRYSRKDEQGNPSETPAQAIQRVVANVASVNVLYVGQGEEVPEHQVPPPDEFRTALRQYEWLNRDGSMPPFDEVLARGRRAAAEQTERYGEMLADRDFIPNSPTWTGAGTGLGQLAACFVLPVKDDLGGEPNGIFDTMREAVLVQQTGGGNGFSFGRIRPRNALVKASMGKASGPVGFLKAYDAAFGIIAQGGTRRGANMGVLPVDHPDIEEFIAAKVVEGEVANFNISVAITDAFMEAVDKDEDFDLVHGDTIYRTIRARDLWDTLVKDAWKLGDPGCLFIDTANRENPLPTRYRLESTNPCGEQWLGPHENCCLGSINLLNFAYREQSPGYGITQRAAFDWNRLAKVIRLATEFLDDVIDANQYVPKVPNLERAAQGARRIGLGAMGLADTMATLGIRYGSEEGQEFAAQVTEFMRYHTMLASIERAKERGPFEWLKGSTYDPEMLMEYGEGAEVEDITIDGGYTTFRLWSRPQPLAPYAHDFGRPPIEWDRVFDQLSQHGIRNAAQLTYAPTGTISNVADLQGSGCEPFFGLVYDRNVMQEGENIVLSYLNPVFEQALESFEGLTESERTDIMEAVKANGGSCQGIDLVPQHIQDAFVVAADVTPEEHVRMQASIQAFVDNSISKTINLPKEATVEDVEAVYRLAYDLGCKGITIYRQGSREVEVLTTGKKVAVEVTSNGIVQVTPENWPHISPMEMPAYAESDGLPARTIKVRTPHGAMWATVTELEGHAGRPFDVRLQLGKAGNDKLADIEALGRSVSLALRTGVEVTKVVEQLEGIGGQTVAGFGPSRVKSAADGLAMMLRRVYMEEDEPTTVTDGDVDASRICPECHNATLVFEQGCLHCEVRLGGCGKYEGCD